ncbi:zinc finger CCCH domain-containing protein 41-like isoform X1 [Cynara cardunculus var. scolymus]|uniref:Nucleotide-binding, alpha-beta plait n=1 Tax=Cynara cardunculus var. scolymus TaxID=59895 RepID=A0A103YHH6_CYNCS|nr:zinc finger CCCH domain-containing protein 41-like isoform X1 [Cynara cardunculus var. scolymus]XP_024984510.1 zinc finger CCCH domain-containing protein 41-like isoform X1 [Cynara cardunculus var. scolymus]KVI09192.1 Nucleotide-binding, alpha-beta plait [Cynara cardunculus var. scolymus]
MELKVSAQERSRSPSVSESNPDEKEISDDDDDDRNHKHRRRDDARSQSLEGDAVEQVFTKPYRRGSKPSENGHIYREAGSQSSEAWKNYTFNPMEKDISAKFDKRRPGFTQSSQGPLDLNQRIRVNQTFSGDPGPIRGRGRDAGLWSQRDSRFSSVDIASQIVQQGSVPPSLFAGRGVPTVSNAYGASWSAFGLIPGIPNGGLDTLHPLGLQGTYRSINPSMNMGMGLARQRCRDFEEQGFCLRGDMCPMEHGVNRIVVEDVQSLSQFNLPVSLQNANVPGAPAGPGPLSASGAPTNSLFSGKALHGKTSKRGVAGNGQGLNDAFIDSSASVGADFYDPDQPLWGNDSQTSPALQQINQSNSKENGPLLDPGPSGNHCVGSLDGSNEHVGKSGGTAMGSQTTSSSVLGRINSTKNRTEMRESMVSKASPSNLIHNETTGKQELSNSAQAVPHHGKHKDVNSSLKMQSGNGKSVHKLSQKAQCTLFVNGIPLQQNRRESLISHFHKFGDVIDIHIPLNSERAFVQFSKREEAEAALTAPDAVMGNRFIKLWWANRDNIPVNKTSGYPVPIPPRGIAVSSALHNGTIAPASTAVPASDQPKPVIAGPKAPPPSQKKLESLEVLKEELRKKQEMLDQKRNDFRRKLDKLEKQATGLKGEIEPEKAAKRQKLGTVADSTKAATTSSSDPETTLSSPRTEVVGNGKKYLESAMPQSSKSTATVALQESPVLKQSVRPLAPIGPSVVANRFKLDNRPTAFSIISTLPKDLADVTVLKEHFSPFGDLSKVELDSLDPADGNNDPGTAKYSARVYFTTRHSAEKAFSSGKCWNGHNLQFSWLKSSNLSKDRANGESPLPTSKGNSDASVGPVVEISKTDSQKPATSGDGESEKIEQKDIDKQHKEPDESNHAS